MIPRPALVLSVLGLVLAGRQLLVRGLLVRAGERARELGTVSRELLPPVTLPVGPRREAFSWLLDPEGDAPAPELPPDQESSGPERKKVPRLGPVPAPVVGLAEQQVLDLAARGAMPRGVSRPASHDLPAGIEILDGGGLGIGWFPGDRLILVDEVPVTDRAEVVRRVLEGRARRESVITATLARRTQSGVVTYRVLVEQPYLAPDSSPVEALAPEGAPRP